MLSNPRTPQPAAAGALSPATHSLPRGRVLSYVLGLTLALGACQLPPPTPSQLLAEVLEDFEGGGGLRSVSLERQTERYAMVHTWHAQGTLISAEDHLWSAAALVTSDKPADLVLAGELALLAAELGDARGFTVQAESTDKLLLSAGKPQRYGTQFIYEPVLERWKLYPMDATTSDAERRAMGVPPLAELMQRVNELNIGLRDDESR